MKILAIETIDISASAALLENETVLATSVLEPNQRSAQFLAPMVRDLLATQNWKPKDVDLIVVAQGPGSFTGLRVGIAFAKVFSYAAETEIIALNTLDILADMTPNEFSRVSIALDAQRGQVAARTYERDANGNWKPCDEMTILDFEDWAEDASENTVLSGPVLVQKASRLPENVQTTPSECWTPSVAQMGRTAYRLYSAGRRDDVWNLLPIYARPAAAEEKRMQKKVED